MDKQPNDRADIKFWLDLKQHLKGLLSFLAVMFLALAIWGIAWQAPHPDAYRAPPGIFSWDFWGYPLEKNAYLRLPQIGVGLNDVFALADGRRVWAVGDKGLIVHTGDGGLSWHKQEVAGNNSALQSENGFFSPFKPAWAGGPEPSNAPPISGNQLDAISRKQQLLQSPEPLNQLDGSLRNSQSNSTEVTPPVNPSYEGKSFQEPSEFNLTLHGVFFLDAERGWVVGENGLILATRDGGKSWSRQPSPVAVTLWDVRFNRSGQGWAVGDRGVILSLIGEQEWRQQSTDSQSAIHGVYVNEAGKGWAVGEYGQVLQFLGNAQGWRPQPALVKETLRGVFVNNRGDSWLVGDQGLMLAGAKGQDNWQGRTVDGQVNLFAIDFSDARHGWAVGDAGLILAYQQGSRDWRLQASGVQSRLAGVAFSDANQGWAVGAQGVILKTDNGGRGWYRQSRAGMAIDDEAKEEAYHGYPAPWWYLDIILFMLCWAAALLVGTKRPNQPKPSDSIVKRVITDKPVDPGSVDLLGARKIAAGLTRFLTNQHTQPPITIAITGEWGSGKSSVMNYLFAGLRRQGLTPVWFNAWHHREEQNVLASILTNIHKQAIGPWWTLNGGWFRLRLLWIRNPWVRLLLLSLVFTLTFSGCWLYNHDRQREQVVHYALYLMGIKQPVMLSQTGYDSLCARPGVMGDSSSTDIQNAGQALFSRGNCDRLKSLVSDASRNGDMLKCENRQLQPCFADPGQWLERVEQTLGLELTLENEVPLLKAIEHLRPDFPLPFPASLMKWLSALFAIMTLLAVKGMGLIGLAPAKVVQSVLSMAGTVPSPTEPVGTRVLFEKHFQRITTVLGKRRLVLFIDDLDRCDREHTRQVLEITNFLASSGELFMVLGMAPRYVLANITLSFQEVARAVHEADVLNGNDGAHGQNAGQSWFARHYLQKLIHIEVPVPKPKPEQVLALLNGQTAALGLDAEEESMQRLERAEQRLNTISAIAGKSLAWVLLILALVVGALSGGGFWSLTDWEQESVADHSVVADSPLAEVGIVNNQVAISLENNLQPAGGTPFRPGVSRDEQLSWLAWLLLVLLMIVIGMFWLLSHANWLEKDGLSWLKPLFFRLKLRLLGPEAGDDSDTFTIALAIWHELITLANPTPRNVKSFVNQLRYFASREFADVQDRHWEAQLVALASMYYAFGERAAEFLAYMPVDQSNGERETFSEPPCQPELWRVFVAAMAQHRAAFMRFPSQLDRRRFAAMRQDVSIHRRD